MLAVSVPPVGMVPNRRKPPKISVQVERLEWKIPRIIRNPSTVNILKVMMALRAL